MRKMCSQIDNIVSIYKTLSKIPSLLDGKLNSTGNKITSSWVIKNLDKGKATKYEDTYVLDNNLNVVCKSDFGCDVSNVLLSQVSPHERFKAVIREEKESKDSRKQFLEIWSKSTLKHSVDLTALDLHGDVYVDLRCVPQPTPTTVCIAMFGALNWSPDESSVVYIAERKVKKSEPYIKRKSEAKKSDGGGEDAPIKGEEHVYRQDWGEQYVGKYLSVVVVCRIETETFTVLEGLPESWCPGQVRFTPDGKGVVGVAFETEPRRLGLVFCTNRPSYVFHLSLDGCCNKISDEGAAVQSPQWSPNGTLVWLQRAAGGPHHACHAIMAKKYGSNDVCSVVEIVETEKQISNGECFFGIYSHHLPHSAISVDGARIVFSTSQKTEIRAYVVDIDSGRMIDISNNKRFPQSTTVLDVRNDVILATCSSITSPPQLFVAKLPPRGCEYDIVWVPVSAPFEVPNAVSNATVEYLYLAIENTEDKVKTFTALYISPPVAATGHKLPLVVYPHGGPHSGFVNAYSMMVAQFAMLGFATVCVNYRGSTGAGDASVRCLISHVGQYDVSDCYLALTTLLERDAHKNIFLCGGSFGGFTVGHLAAKYPDLFKAMVMRNPLIDMATKGHSADNSDGCAVEAGFKFTEEGPVSEEELIAMRRCSPMAHVHKVKAPTALLIGVGDRRVPPYQGLEYYRRLKANGVKAKLYWYDDNHNLASTPIEMDQTINTARWFIEHLGCTE